MAAGIGGATSILDSTIDLAQTNDGFDDEIARIRNQAFSPSGTYSLMNQYNNMFLGAPKGWEDFGGKTSGQYAKGILGTTATGALAGTQIMPGIGTLVGGLIGLGAGAIGMAANQIGTKQNEKEYYSDLRDSQNFAMGNWNTARNAFSENQFSDALKSFYRSAEYGGMLGTHGSDFSNDIKYINVGGTHEQNPNNGVLMGVDEEGTPNLVEEGEVIFNDYVFSARLKPSKKALNDSLIGDKYLGMTYAEIAEKLAEKSEEMPNDKIEQNTLNANFKRLITIQEEQRAKNEAHDANIFDEGGTITPVAYRKKIKDARQAAHNYAVQYGARGSEIYEKLYNQKYKELTADVERRWANTQAQQRANQKAIDEKKARLDQMARYMEQHGIEVPKVHHGRLVGGTGYDYQNIERRYNELVNSGIIPPMAGGKDEVSAMEAELEQNYPIPDNTQQEQQAAQQAAQTAEETVVKSDPSGATSSSNAASTSNGVSAGSGTRAPVRDGNIIKPDLTNARVGNGQIQYDRNQDGEAFENQQYYQDFLQYMNSIKGTPEAQAWIDRINAGEFGDMNGYRIDSFEEWYRLATDKKVGPVHSATLAAAQSAAQPNSREKVEPILPNSGLLPNEPTLEKVMGVKEEGLHDPDRPRIDTYTGPGVEGEEEPKDYSYLLRYAPVIGNALALLSNRKDYSDVHRFEGMTANPRTVRFSPIGTYIRHNIVAPSEMSTPIENQMAGERNYISNNSLGNSTASNNYMLASDYLGNSRIGAAYLQGKQYNAEQRQKAAAYNLGIDQYNSEGAFKEQQQNMSLNNYYLQRAIYDYNMRNGIDTAYNQARSSNLTALFNNLGNIGLDTFNRNRANAASPAYNYEGRDGFIRYMLDYYDSLYNKDNNNG